MRRKLIAGNWKMNAGPKEAENLLNGLKEELGNGDFQTDILVFPPYLTISAALNQLKDTPIQVGAQNLHFQDNGAYTGEISSRMIKEAGCKHVIVGHSERREYFGENNEIAAKKTAKAIADGLHVVLCVGETLEERKKDMQQKVVIDQLKAVINRLTEEDTSSLTIAYEPVWAIGTGETATPGQAQEMHLFIRNYLSEIWSTQRLQDIRILYGGSMKPANAEELLQQPDVDGGLVGGASLNAESFAKIIRIAESFKKA